MKLRNKKTGEIVTSKELLTDEFIIDIFSKDFNYFNSKINKIQEEWEDYEEPKEYWCIDWTGGVNHITLLDDSTDKYEKSKKQIGNYFETEEEAEKAVEKLKAVKRLKDKGFRFIGKTYETDKRFGSIFYKVNEDTYSEDIIDDLDLLFGGE